ncbi:hypothetical protein SADUNF_Sadunf14G0106500 [Salix dunnii]|uniref:Uncharacterized protein n=1 Tax=Salix dunnii TaxID=1413687 RepID=A0A835MK22_9ROSI|nr:hypothetical protein SADUNF_Sadunf14G0106500 [Salix dunnii]
MSFFYKKRARLYGSRSDDNFHLPICVFCITCVLDLCLELSFDFLHDLSSNLFMPKSLIKMETLLLDVYSLTRNILPREGVWNGDSNSNHLMGTI